MIATVLLQIARDFRHAVRMLPKMRGLAAVVIGSIGVGIGVNATVFSWIQARVMSPIAGVDRSSRVLLVEPRGESGMYPGTSWLEFRDLRQRLAAFDDVFAFRMTPLTVGAAELPERATGMLVSGNYFHALGLQPARGRFPGEGDNGATSADPVVVVSFDFWQSRLGGDADVVGRTLRVNERPLTIAAVAPPEFQGTLMGLSFDLWVPADLAPVLFDGTLELENRGQRGYSAMGMLRPGTSRAQAQRDLDTAMRQLAQEFPETNATFTGEVLTLSQAPRGPQRFLSTALAILQGAMLLVLLAVCGNTANLVLARASARDAEVSVRLAMGAARWRIVSLFLCESVLLGLGGALLGILIAVWGTEALRAVPMPTPGGMSLKFQTGVDWVTLTFAGLLGVGSGIAFGLAPALHLARVGPRIAIRAAAAPVKSRLRDVLMLVEIALAVVVIAVGVLFLKSFQETQSTEPGFRRAGVMLATYDLRGRTRSVTPAASAAFATRLLERLRALPSIDAAALSTSVPLDIHGMPSRSFTVEGRARPDGLPDTALTNTVTPGYFTALGIPILSGRDFVDLADTATAPEAVVNAEFVRSFLPDAEPIGRAIESAGRRYVIAGVVKNSRYNAFDEPPTPMIYLSYRDRPATVGEIHVRTRAGSETAVVPEIRRLVRDLDPALPVYNVRTMTEHVDTNLVFRRIPARIFAVLVPVLLAVAALGIYAVVAYAVARRRSEIGMRIALGATGPRIVRQLVGETLRVVALGAAAGWIVAAMIGSDLAGSGTADIVALGAVPIVLIAVAAVASWMPARRAARIDPMAALKSN